MSDAAAPTFTHLDRVHDDLMEEFLKHQDALVENEIERARFHLDRFVFGLNSHIQAEDEVLLPLYIERVEQPQIGCSPELLFSEHRKLERLMKRVLERMSAIEQSGKLSARERVYVIEEERMLKEVLDHHDRRERAAFFKLLDEAITGDERERVLEACAKIQAPAEALRQRQ